MKSVDWNQKGKIDLVMATGIRDIAASLKELKRSKVDSSSITEEMERVISEIEEITRITIPFCAL